MEDQGKRNADKGRTNWDRKTEDQPFTGCHPQAHHPGQAHPHQDLHCCHLECGFPHTPLMTPLYWLGVRAERDTKWGKIAYS